MLGPLASAFFRDMNRLGVFGPRRRSAGSATPAEGWQRQQLSEESPKRGD